MTALGTLQYTHVEAALCPRFITPLHLFAHAKFTCRASCILLMAAVLMQALLIMLNSKRILYTSVSMTAQRDTASSKLMKLNSLGNSLKICICTL